MKIISNQMFNKSDSTLEESLNQRLKKHQVIVGNVVNANTPGYRALGYDFEKQLQTSMNFNEDQNMRTNDARHFKNAGVSAEGEIQADLYVKPQESIGNDGNTVDVDAEMSELAANQILYNASLELLNRRLNLMKYGINGGR